MFRKIVGGYVKVKFPIHPYCDKSGFVYEHRLMVEVFIGRILGPEESVHHVDKNKQNNKISNLMLFPTNKVHIRFHTKIRQHGMTEPIKREIRERWNGLK